MPAYVILHNQVTDPEMYAQYVEQVTPSLMKHGAEILIIDNDAECVEGTKPYPRTVMLRFPSRDAAKAWYTSREYLEIYPLRANSSEGFAVICDEYVMPQG
jgi:uncharacterized protein (DUF1330 family)